jgi:polar amino acid transport system substrate-binding protein
MSPDQLTESSARAAVAPTGRLRAGMNLSNTLFTMQDKATGELNGVSVDLIRELATRLRIEVEYLVYPTPGHVADASDKQEWDVALLAIEPARAQTIAFSPAMTEIEASYFVHKGSALQTPEQVDASGIRIAVADKAGYELYLTRTLRHATLVRAPSFDASLSAFEEHRADVMAALKPNLLKILQNTPSARILDKPFMVVNHGLGTPRNRVAAAAYLKMFVDEINASDFVARSIARHGVKGLAPVKRQGEL